MLHIKTGDNYSLNMLKDYTNNGSGLFMTPHAGNRRLNELMLPFIGAKSRTVFTNQIIRDVLDKPDLLIVEETELKIVEQIDPVLTPYSTFATGLDVDAIAERFDLGELLTPSQMIYKSLKKVQRDNFQFAQEALYLEDNDFANRFLGTLITHDFSEFDLTIFDRQVDSDGQMQRVSVNQDTKQIQSYLTYFQELIDGIKEGVTIDFSGVQVANMVNVLADIVQVLYNRKDSFGFFGDLNDDVLILSGPSMYKYVKNKKNLGFLQSAYSFLAAEFDLPETLNCVYVPFSEFEFLQPSQNVLFEPVLNESLDLFNLVKATQSEFRNPTLSSEQRGVLISETNVLRTQLKEAQKTVQFSVNTEFFTQYDAILNPDESLEFPKGLMDISIADIKKFGFLSKAQFNK